MAFDYDFTNKLKGIIQNLRKRDPKKARMIRKKVEQIINCDETTIEHYKNLRHGMKDRKRVRINKSFVLTFRYDKEKRFILFLDFDHHDNVYKR